VDDQRRGYLTKLKNNKGVVCHTMALPFTTLKKKYLKTKEELWKLKYFSMRKYNLQKNSLKETLNPSRYYYNSLTNLKFQQKPKNIIFQKSSYKKIRPIIVIT
jgi:hypothetical protein